jgi:hypothetical protein
LAEEVRDPGGGEPGLAAADHHHVRAPRHDPGCAAVNFLRQARET